jgi:hypothetical protein
MAKRAATTIFPLGSRRCTTEAPSAKGSWMLKMGFLLRKNSFLGVTKIYHERLDAKVSPQAEEAHDVAQAADDVGQRGAVDGQFGEHLLDGGQMALQGLL